LSITAHRSVTTPVVVSTFRDTANRYGDPASTLTDNGMVFTVKHSGWGRRGGRNGFETELRNRGIIQKNGTPFHPQTQGKVERFQQTLKNWLHARPDQPVDLAQLQRLLDTFAVEYNNHRPHRALPHHSTPGDRYRALPKATPAPGARVNDSHSRVRHDRIDKTGCVTLRVGGRLHHIGIGRAHTNTTVLLLINDLNIDVINATTGELLRHLTIDPNRNYQPQNTRKPPNQ
jgi:hypothetical protein